jgi:hypothetical protein
MALKRWTWCVLAGTSAVVLAAAACGEDEAVVRARVDAGPPVAVATDGGDASVSACGAVIPATYESPTFETNAAEELLLRKALDDFMAPMKAVETALGADGGAPAPFSEAQLKALYAAGSPSLKTITTAYFQARVDAWLTAYEAALADGAYQPAVPDGVDKGGVLGKYVFDANGLDLRQAIDKGSYGAAFYNHAVALIASGTVTVGTIDRLIAAFGAHPSFPNNHNAPQNKDVNAAGYAARRDSKDAANPGPYQRAKAAAIRAKATTEAGSPCNVERDAAIAAFLGEWERSNYATVVFYANDTITKLSASTPDYAALLHNYGEIFGFVAGFKTVLSTRRIITDAQIDGLLQRMLAPEGSAIQAYRLKTDPIQAATAMQQLMGDIKTIYGFTDAEIERFKTNF